MAPQTQIMDKDEPNFSEMENPIIDETNTTIDNTQKDENEDSCQQQSTKVVSAFG